MTTPGQSALREAARLEAARVYGGVVPEHKTQPGSYSVAALDAELRARDELQAHDPACGSTVDNPDQAVCNPVEPVDEPTELSRADAALADMDLIVCALRAGQTNSQIITAHGVDYATVRAARKRLMAANAA